MLFNTNREKGNAGLAMGIAYFAIMDMWYQYH